MKSRFKILNWTLDIMGKSEVCNLIALEYFIESTRDAGYKNIVSALAELVDNSFEAEANKVKISFDKSSDGEITVMTADDGCGMKPSVLQLALQFGGSTRFNSRSNSGRFGMGLPNGSLSQARRVEVFTWKKSNSVWRSYLDVDEIVAGKLKSVPISQKTNSKFARTDSGTIIVWSKCDRIEMKNEKVFLAKIRQALGRLFRKSLWAGREIIVGGEPVIPFDPLYLNNENSEKAVPFGSKLKYEVALPDNCKNTSTITVQFVELPIQDWYELPNEQKQKRGISKNAGVSIVRAGREIDYGWYFTGKKRKENYDDWWRCEICFDPQLDELFGVTNTKQGIRPTEYLKNILSPDIERIANTLNARVRTRFAELRAGHERTSGEKIAASRDRLLEPPEKAFAVSDNLSLYNLQPSHYLSYKKSELIRGLNFRIKVRKLPERSFYIPLLAAKEITVLLNENHRFYECFFLPYLRSSNSEARLLRQYMELTLMAAACAECTISSSDSQNIIQVMRKEWGKVSSAIQVEINSAT